LKGHTLACGAEKGGFSKWPNYHPDVLHTYLALCGLSFGNEPGLAEIDYTVCIPKKAVARLPHYKDK
jgi:prenyltransferase beta subunit